MNKLLFEFGFSLWIFILTVLIAVLVTFVYYKRTNPSISLKDRVTLGAFRFVALAILFFVLAEPLAIIIKNYFEKPKIAVIIDNSQSMELKFGNTDKNLQLSQSLNLSGFEDFDKFPLKYFTFDNTFRVVDKLNTEKLIHKGEGTNLSLAFRKLYELKQEENIQAVILFTDGIYNLGENPLYSAEKLVVPIFTVGIGDTIPPKDIAITSLLTNDVGFVGKTQPVKVSVKSYGIQGNAVVKLFENQNLLAEKTIEVNTNSEDYSVIFDYSPKEEGFQKLTIKIDNFPNEFTNVNNTQSEIVKVIKNKKRFLLLAGFPNPDISFLKSIIYIESGSQISTFIQKKNAEFYEPQPNKKDFEEAGTIIFVGFPIASSPDYIINWVKEELEQGKAFLFILQPSTDFSKLKRLDDFLPFTYVSNNTREYSFVGNFNPSKIGHPILHIGDEGNDIKLLNQLPPIFRTELFTKPKPESEVLATIKVNNVDFQEPFLIVRDFQNRKAVAILGYGLYRWRLLGLSTREIMGKNNEATDVGSNLLSNVLNWLAVSDEFSRVKIKTNKTKYLSNEKVGIVAQIFDAAYSPIENALVKVRINKGNQSFENVVPYVGGGIYSLQVGPYSEGDYNFIAEVFVGNNKIGESKGRFVVEKSNLEFTDFRTRTELLRYIAQQTGGKYFRWNETQELKNTLNKLNLKTKVITKKEEINIWNNLTLLTLAIFLLGIEWFLRRQKGLL